MRVTLKAQVGCKPFRQAAQMDPTNTLPVDVAFEQQARLGPDAVAVVCGQRYWTYGALQTRVLQLSQHLQALGVGPEVLVGLFAERSLEALVGMLSVLKAGGAYVPLDVSAPWRRTALILKACGVRTVLVQSGFEGRFRANGFELVRLGFPPRVRPRLRSSTCRDGVMQEALAYVLYTSGTTGRPKGVMIRRSSLSNYIGAVADEYQIGPDDRILQFAPLTFDNSAEEIFMTLCRGATLVLRPTGLPDSPSLFLSKCRHWGITVLDLPTAYWHTLAYALETAKLALPTTLRLVIVGGEKASWEALKRWRGALGQTVRLLNTYGPTETTIGATVSDQTESGTLLTENPDVPIGRPVRGLQAYVVDEELEPVTVGVAGQLVLGGAGLARGYFGQAGLTANCFRPDPFTAIPGSRLYLTGDRVRRRDDGELDFIGRLDQQVKIRGMRVEPNEVAAVLQRCSAVRDCVVLTRRERSTGSYQLVAYVVPQRKSGRLPGEAFRRWLSQRLPAAMVPATCIIVHRLPRTSAGKLDLAALSVPKPRRVRVKELPRTDSERIVGRIWRELFGSAVGRSDDFFELGGHSLLLVLLQVELERSVGIELSVSDLIRHPTVAAQATLLDARVTTSSSTSSDLCADASLSQEIRPVRREALRTTGPESLFLTGATGFVGSHVLAELLQQTLCKVICLVRASDEIDARRRIEESLHRSGLWRSGLSCRIVPLAGDIARPHFGLETATLRRMAASIGAIYHCAASVNLLYPYEALRPTNVRGVQEVLRLASLDRAIRLHHISTLDVLDTTENVHAGIAQETPLSAACDGLSGGYAQSKWAAERLLQQAAERGFRVTVYRLGWVTGSSLTGFMKLTDLPARLIKAVIEMGCVPDVDGVDLRPTPVDFVSRAVVALSLREDSAGRFFHLTNPQSVTVKKLVELGGELGYPLRMLDFRDWFASLPTWTASAASGDGAALGALMKHCFRTAATQPGEVMTLNDERIKYEVRRTTEALAKLRIECPPPDRALLATYIDFFVSSGFLKRRQPIPAPSFEAAGFEEAP